jgi:hypothetical protein
VDHECDVCTLQIHTIRKSNYVVLYRPIYPSDLKKGSYQISARTHTQQKTAVKLNYFTGKKNLNKRTK